MEDKRKKSIPLTLEVEDEIVDEGHPFALPQIVEIDNILNKSLLKIASERQSFTSLLQKRVDSTTSRNSSSCSTSRQFSDSLSAPRSMGNSSAFRTSSIRFPDIFSSPSSPDSIELVKSVQSMELYEEIPNIVSAYDYIIYNCVNLYVELSFSIDQEVFKQANKVLEVFRLQRHFLLASVGRFDLDNPVTGTGPGQATKIKEVKQMASRRFQQRHYSHLLFIADTIGALGWVVSGSRPNDFIREIYNFGRRHADTIRQNETLSRHQLNVRWISAWKFVITELDAYVMSYHPDGLKWQKS